MNFYKHYIGDFQRDTGHLSLTERGAYLALIHHYYATEKPLPNNIDALCRIAGAVSPIERKAVKVAIGFFEPVDSGLMHSRIEAEIHKAGEQSNTNRDIALAREAKRRAEKQAKQDNENSTNRAGSVPRNEHENSTNQTPDTRHHSELSNKQETLNIVEPTEIGLVCSAIQSLFEENKIPLLDASQGNPDFLACIEAGATVAEFLDAARIAIQKKKGFKYLVGIVLNQRKQANVHTLHKGAMPASTSREAGRNIAAKSFFKPEYTQHLQGNQTNLVELENEVRAIAN